MNCTLVRNLCEFHHSWWNNPLILRIARISPNLQIWSFCGKDNATNPHTWKFFFQLILGLCTLAHCPYWKFYIPIRCSRFFTVTSIMVSKQTYLKRWVSNSVFSTSAIQKLQILSSVVVLCPRMYWHRITAAAAAAFRGGRVLRASWRQPFPDARLKIHLRFNVIHIPRLVKIHIRHSGILNDGTCIGRWFSIHSRIFLLVTSVNHFVNDCPN